MLTPFLPKSNSGLSFVSKLQLLNMNQAQELVYKLEAEIFWGGKTTLKAEPAFNLANTKNRITNITKLLEKGFFGYEQTELGSKLVRNSVFGLDMFERLFLSGKNSKWIVGNSYYGIWIIREELKILHYCEGDVTTFICENEEMFNKELDSSVSYYREEM